MNLQAKTNVHVRPHQPNSKYSISGVVLISLLKLLFKKSLLNTVYILVHACHSNKNSITSTQIQKLHTSRKVNEQS